MKKECSGCHQVKSLDDFYTRSKRKIKMGECKMCWILRVKSHRNKVKLQCIDYKGGKCSKCGYDKCAAALDFHHLDPTQKDFDISHSNKRSLESLKPELDKCILICANCHRELHSLN